MDMKDFLSLYFRQMRFNDMPAAARARFDDFVTAGDHMGHTKTWEKDLLKHDGNGNLEKVGKSYISADLPDAQDINVLSDEEAIKLYKEFRKAFRTMAANRDDFADNKDATNYLNDYFGTGLLFQNAEASDEAIDLIDNDLLTMLDKNPALENILRQYGVLDDKFSFSDLRSGTKAKRYNNDSNFAEKVISAARVIRNAAAYDEELRNALSPYRLDKFDDIINGFDKKPIDPLTLRNFREELPLMLNQLHDNKKIRETFAQYGGNKITKHYDNATKEVAYDDPNSDDFIPPKNADVLTPWQQLSDKWGTTYDQVLKKYLTLKGDTNFVQDQAKNIVAALAKEKINPTDGLAAIVDKAGNITKALKNKTPRDAAKHFDWTVKVLGELKTTMPKAFAGALSNGTQLKAIVEQIIIRAAESKPPKLQEAKTALEMLSVMKYGFTTSKIMDNLKKETKGMAIFSDGKLSWNKTQGVQFVTKAVDQSMRAAFLGLGYAITMAGNAYKMNSHQTRFKAKGELTKKADAWRTKNTQNLDAERTRTQNLNQRDENTINDQRQILQDINSGPYAHMPQITDPNSRNAVDAQLQTSRRQENSYRNWLKDNKNDYNQAQQFVHNYDEYQRQINQLNANLDLLDQRLQQTEAAINALNGATAPDELAQVQALMQHKLALQDQIDDITRQRDKLESDDNAPTNDQAYIADKQLIQDYEDRQNDLNTLVGENDTTASRLEQFDNANATIKELSEAITTRNNKIDNWDNENKNVYSELMAHWDFLEMGRLSRTGRTITFMPRTTKANQTKFNANKVDMLNAFYTKYNNRI